jgi:hypothetical protein
MFPSMISIGKNFCAMHIALFSTISLYAQEDPFPNGRQLSASNYFKRCESAKLSQYEKGSCYSSVVRGLKSELKAEIAKKLVQIEAIADEDPAPGLLTGKENATKWRSDFLKTQKFWEEYSGLHCKSYIDYENYGGSGAGLAALGCEIRHLVARLNEVRSTT